METGGNNRCEIAESLRKGDEAVLKELFERLYDPLLFFATQYVRQIQVAEESVADSFYKLWVKRADFVHIKQIKSFLYVCTRNACLKHIRDSKSAPISEDLDTLEARIEDDYDLVEKIIRVEVIDQIYQYAGDLPDKQRTVFHMFFVEELSLEEISKRLNMSLQAVYVHKSRALAYLRSRSLVNPGPYALLRFLLIGLTQI